MRMLTTPLAACGLVVAALAACAPGAQEPREAAPAPALAAAVKAIALPFVENDYATAFARAKDKGLPLFVEVWAPW